MTSTRSATCGRGLAPGTTAASCPSRYSPNPVRAARRRSFLARAVLSDDHTVICAWRDGRLAGFAVTGPCEPAPDPDPRITSELHSLHVDPGCFRQRIGTNLHSACVGTWRSLEVAAVRLWVVQYNHAGPGLLSKPRLGTQRPAPSG